jgi:hypothetical protein
MYLLNHFDTDKNFWSSSPQLKILFHQIYSEDKSKDKKNSSTILWCIALLLHPESKFANYPYQKRLEIVQDYAQNHETEFNPELYPETVHLFEEGVLSKAQKFLVKWEKKLEERQEFIDSLKFDLETVETVDKILSNTNKLWKQYQECLKDVEEERSKNVGQGGAMESASEQHLI